MSIFNIWGLPFIRSLLSAEHDCHPDGEGSVVKDGAADREPIGAESEDFDSGDPAAPLRWVPPVIDIEDDAEDVRYVRYKNGKSIKGKVKRTRYRRRKVATVATVVVHATGAERKASSSRWKYVTAQRVIRTDGARMKVHPLSCRLICSNALDRKPHCGVGIEVGGNFEGYDGTGNWYKPDKFGRGRASVHQLIGLACELVALQREIAEAGGRLKLVAPHRVSGQKNGKPNRSLCCGSRLWQAAEHVALGLGLEVPALRFKLGGTPIPMMWRSRRWLNKNGHNPDSMLADGTWRESVSIEENEQLDEAIAAATGYTFPHRKEAVT